MPTSPSRSSGITSADSVFTSMPGGTGIASAGPGVMCISRGFTTLVAAMMPVEIFETVSGAREPPDGSPPLRRYESASRCELKK